jgi:hypothetical protein
MIGDATRIEGGQIVKTLLTTDFSQSVRADLRSRKYRAMYLGDAIAAFHDGEFTVGKRMLCNYINATTGFDALSHAVGTTAASLRRALAPKGRPRASEFFGLLRLLQEADGFDVRVLLKGTGKSRSH